MFVNIVIGLHRTGDGRTRSTYVGNTRSGAVLLSRYDLLDIAVQERTLVDIATYGPNPVSSLSSRGALNTGYGCAGFRAARLPLNQSFCPCPRVAGGAYLKVLVSCGFGCYREKRLGFKTAAGLKISSLECAALVCWTDVVFVFCC